MKWRDSLSRSFDKRQKYREDNGEYPSTTKIGANELYRKVKMHLGLFSKAVEADHHIDIMSESINVAHFSKRYFEAKQQQYDDKPEVKKQLDTLINDELGITEEK